jgi:hypothetical protein
MAVQLSQVLGSKLIEALGMPKHVVWFELRCAVDEVVSVRCEYHPEEPNGLSPETVLAKYEVVERTARVDFDAWLNARKTRAHLAMMERHRALSRMDERLFCKP